MPTPTFTTRLALRKPDPDPATGDFVNVSTDLNANYDKLDAAVGAVSCTSGTRPATPYLGQFARETDTANLILCVGTGPAVWLHVWMEGQSFPVDMVRASSANTAFTATQTGDATKRFLINAAGTFAWSDGTAAADVNLYRASADVLKTDDAMQILGDLKAGPALISLGRGYVVGNNVITAGLVAGTTGTEVVVPSASHATESTYSLPTGRLYKAILHTGLHPGSASESVVSVRIRKGAAAVGGTLLGERQIHIPSQAFTNVVYRDIDYYFKNTSGSTVATKLTLTNQRMSGGGTCSLYGTTAPLQAYLTVEDIGATADHPILAALFNSV